jgi:hypothetical protein
MKKLYPNKPVQRDELIRKIKSIDSISGAQEPVLSCYLDTRPGSQACHDFIDNHAPQIMNSNLLDPGLNIDGAVSLIHQAIDKERHALTQGLAIFSNVQQERSNHEYLALPAPVKNQLSIYPSADIMPLQSMLNTLENITLLVFIDGVMQLYERNLGYLKQIAWASAPHLELRSDMRGDISDEKRKSAIVQRQLHAVCLSLLKLSSKPLLIAAQAGNIETLKAWLPKKIGWQLMDTIMLPQAINHSQAKQFIDTRINQLKSTQKHSVISRLVNSLQHKERACLGIASSIDALNNNYEVERLVVAENYQQPNFWKCAHCATFYHTRHPSGACLNCHHTNLVPANHVTEASWLAFRRHIPVTLVESDELSYMGGMGCLFGQKHDSSFESIPSQHHQSAHLERVA